MNFKLYKILRLYVWEKHKRSVLLEKEEKMDTRIQRIPEVINSVSWEV